MSDTPVARSAQKSLPKEDPRQVLETSSTAASLAAFAAPTSRDWVAIVRSEGSFDRTSVADEDRTPCSGASAEGLDWHPPDAIDACRARVRGLRGGSESKRQARL